MSKFDDLKRRRTSEAPPELQPPLATGTGQPPEVGEAKQLKAIVSAELHKRVKLASVALERDISEITTEALENWLNKHQKD